jgi:hypothetical protein
LADITSAPDLKRQAAFALLATSYPDDVDGLLERLGGFHPDLAQAFRSRQARHLVAAAFGGRTIPTGYLRALARIGADSLREPALYRRLFEIYAAPAEKQKAHALRYCGALNASKIEVVDHLDPLLIHPTILGAVGSVARAQSANALLALLREICSGVSDEDLLQSIIAASGQVETAARRWLEKAGCFPPPPFTNVTGLEPLANAQQVLNVAKCMRNCLKTRIPEAILGMTYFYRTEEASSAPTEMWPVVVEITPLSNGTWTIAGVHGPRNRRPPARLVREVIRPLLDRGVATSTATRSDAATLQSALGAYRWDAFYPPRDDEDEEDQASHEVTETEIA